MACICGWYCICVGSHFCKQYHLYDVACLGAWSWGPETSSSLGIHHLRPLCCIPCFLGFPPQRTIYTVPEAQVTLFCTWEKGISYSIPASSRKLEQEVCRLWYLPCCWCPLGKGPLCRIQTSQFYMVTLPVPVCSKCVGEINDKEGIGSLSLHLDVFRLKFHLFSNDWHWKILVMFKIMASSSLLSVWKPCQPRAWVPTFIQEVHRAMFSSVQSLTHVWLFANPWTAAPQASLSITNSWSLLKLMSIESVMPSSHLILCCPLLLLPPTPPSIRVFSSESTLCIRWPKYWSFSFNISPSNEYSGLICFRNDLLGLLAVQGTLNSLLQHHSSNASILQHSAFFMVQLSHPYMTTGKTTDFTTWTFVGKVMSLLFNMLSRLVITFLPMSVF